MPLYDFSEFLKLSSALNYNLSAASLNRYNVLMFIIDGKHFHSNDTEDRESKRIVMETLSYLFNAYSQKRRRLGPLAVLHPLRTAALFARNFNTLNLIKNAVLLSLIRQKIVVEEDPISQLLFDAVCMASLKEAQRTLIHLIGYHFKDIPSQRTLLIEAMDYCYSGGTGTVTVPDADQMLDGLFSSYFAHTTEDVRNQKLDVLYQNKPLMIQASK